jgi:hypothetical protein
MSIFGDQSERLLRETWGSPTELAEELYAMFGVNTPLQIQGPVTITNTTPGPALTVNQLGAYTPGDFPPGLTPPPSPGISILSPGTDATPSGAAPPPAPVSVGGGGGGGIPGQVQSGGPGPSYQVAIYTAGLAGGFIVVTVTQLQIDPDETIPVGTWALVTQAGANYYMNVPTWAADLT